jgi:hypothetical protein
MLSQNRTTILTEEQLARFKERLDDPARHWKITDSDYSERELWLQYVEAYEDAMPPTRVDLADIRRKYHAAELKEEGGGKDPD